MESSRNPVTGSPCPSSGAVKIAAPNDSAIVSATPGLSSFSTRLLFEIWISEPWAKTPAPNRSAVLRAMVVPTILAED